MCFDHLKASWNVQVSPFGPKNESLTTKAQQ